MYGDTSHVIQIGPDEGIPTTQGTTLPTHEVWHWQPDPFADVLFSLLMLLIVGTVITGAVSGRSHIGSMMSRN